MKSLTLNMSTKSVDVEDRLLNHRDLTPEEEKDLARRFEGGDKSARDKLITHNMRLAMSIARKYKRDQTTSLSDLLSLGVIGLTEAAERFDPDLGYRFSTYATWWIRRSISRGLGEMQGIIRLPVHVRESCAKFLREKTSLEQRLGREATQEDMVKHLDYSPKKVKQLLESCDSEVSSLDSLPSEPRCSSQADSLLEDSDDWSRVEQALDTLSKTERAVICQLFGLDTQKLTIVDTAQVLGVSRECVRQTRNSAVTKLQRQVIRSHKLLG